MTNSQPAAYISYAWGEDKTPEGREREAIVDDLCRSFAEVGIVIGRDKNEVKIGDSIEAFGRRIAKAPVILAVISQVSLRSKWCMIYELYEAYLRCGCNSEEFSDRVVALVLEDAERDLDVQTSDALKDYWKAWHCTAQSSGGKRSHEYAKLMQKSADMIESLGDMLLAINYINMPRGSAEIRRDDFKSIIDYVEQKLGGAAQEVPEPPPLDLEELRITLNDLAEQYAALSPAQLHGCWHGAIQATWPRQTAASLFPQLGSVSLLAWADLQGSLKDPGQWSHLQIERIVLLFEHFATRLESAASRKLEPNSSSIPPSLAVLIKDTGDKTPEGYAAYRCNAVLCTPLVEGGFHYEQVEPAANHMFCFTPHKDRPSWLHPGVVLGQLWQAAQAKLAEQGQLHREPFLDLFLPRSLLDQGWAGLELVDGEGETSTMRTISYRLRSFDRWTKPQLLGYKEHLERKHRALQDRSGHWKLLAGGHAGSDLHSELSLSRSSSPGQPETVAILQLGAMESDLRDREMFYKAAIESSAPVVMWLHPSHEDQPAKVKSDQVARLLQALKLKKPTKTNNHSQVVQRDPFELPSQKQGLPSSLVVLIEDCLEMDPKDRAKPRLIAAAQQAPSLGYRSG